MIENRTETNGSAYLSLMSYLADIRSIAEVGIKVHKSTVSVSGFYARASNDAVIMLA